MFRCASIHNDMPFTFVWLFSDSSTSSVPSMSSSGKDINMFGMFFAPMLRTWIPRSSSIPWFNMLQSISCGSSLNGTEIYPNDLNVSTCIGMYQNAFHYQHYLIFCWPSDWKAWGPPWRSSDAIPAIRRLKNWNHIGTQHYNSNEETYKAFQMITKHCKQGNHTKSVQQPSWHLIQPLFEGVSRSFQVSMNFQPRFSGSRMDEAARKTGEFVTNPN